MSTNMSAVARTLGLAQSNSVEVQFTPPLPLDALDAYPTLKFLAAIMTIVMLVVGGLGWLRSEKFAKKEAATPLDASHTPDAAIQFFFEGPLKAIFEALRRI